MPKESPSTQEGAGEQEQASPSSGGGSVGFGGTVGFGGGSIGRIDGRHATTWVPGAPTDEKGEPIKTDVKADEIRWLKDTIAGKVVLDIAAYTTILKGTAISAGGAGPSKTPRPEFGLPKGCEPAFLSGGGYERLAIPPAMTDNSETEAAIVDAAVRLLGAGTEIEAWCPRTFDEEVENPNSINEGDEFITHRVVRGAPVWIISVSRSEKGLRIQAWSHLNGGNHGAYPD